MNRFSIRGSVRLHATHSRLWLAMHNNMYLHKSYICINIFVEDNQIVEFEETLTIEYIKLKCLFTVSKHNNLSHLRLAYKNILLSLLASQCVCDGNIAKHISYVKDGHAASHTLMITISSY